LAGLAPQLSGEVKAQILQQALDAVLKIDRENLRVEVLATLAPYMNDEFLRQALTSSFNTFSENLRLKSLAVLILHLHGEERMQALLGLPEVLKINKEVLISLVPYLTNEQLI
jgi:hypothetical protein